jgi:PAS domain S-box-containing protein
MTAALPSSNFTNDAPPPSPAEQLRQANQQLSVVNQELDMTNEQLRVTNAQLLVANEQLHVYNEEIRTQAADLRRAEQAVRQLNAELALTNAGLLDTIADSLQATEFARAEAEAQRQRLQRLIAEAPAMIAVLTGPDHLVELANDHFRAIFGHRKLVGQPIRQAVPELADQPFFDQLAEVYRTGETYTGIDVPVLLDRTSSGRLERIFATYIFQATRDGAGAIDGLLIFAYEVTEQVRARQEREAYAQQRQLVTDALPVLIAYVDQDQRYQFNNQAYEEWFHQSPAALRGRRLREVVGEAAYAAAQPYIERALAGEQVEFEARMPYREDFVRYIHTRFVPNVHRAQVVGFYCLISDITEQVMARAEIEHQQQQQYNLFMAAPGPIAILEGPHLVFVLVNPAYQQLFPQRELLGLPLLDALPELAATTIPGLCYQVYETGESCLAEELPLQLLGSPTAAPQESYWTFTHQARHNAQQAVDGVVVFAYDVTSQVRARQVVEADHQQAQALNQHLARTNEELDALVHTASHDLQGPLLNIDGLLDVLSKELPPVAQPAPVAHILKLLHESVERLQHTLAQLSDIAYAPAEAGPPTSPVLLAHVVQGVVLDLALPIAEAGAQVMVDVADCRLVGFAEKKLRSVVYNLLSNAIKHRHPDRVPQVRVQCRPKAHFWALEVQDNGLGLTLPGDQSAAGWSKHSSTHVEGLGVGLYVVQRLLESEGGHLEVASQLSQGATFTAYFKR